MGLIYLNSIKSFNLNKKKIIFSDLNKSLNGSECKKLVSKIIFFLKEKKIRKLAIISKNSIYWPLWYIAADSICEEIYIINPGTDKKIIKTIVKKNKIDLEIYNTEIVLDLRDKLNDISIKNNKIGKRYDILFTSGTTNVPKGVIINEKSYIHVAKILTQKFKQTKNDRELLSMPLFHSFGLARLRCVILAKSSALITDGLSRLPEIFKLSQKTKITGISLVPSAIIILKNLLRKRITELSVNLKYFEIGSSAINDELRKWLKENFKKTIIIHHFGMTEASRSFLRYRGKLDNLNIPNNWVGEPINGCDFKLINIKKDKRLKINVGELVIRGQNLYSGYLNMKKFNKNSWFKTGDLCSLENNKVKLIGRKDNEFNIGGYKVQAEFIEKIIEEITYVKSCVCFRSNDKELGDQINCVIDLKSKNKLNLCRKELNNKFNEFPSYYKPKKIVFHEVLKTENGKKIRNFNIDELSNISQ